MDIDSSNPIVLVVDDDPAVCNSLKFALGLEGYRVRAFSDAAALLKAEDLPHSRCLVIDLKLPGMDGLELLDELRRRNVTAPGAADHQPSIAPGSASDARGKGFRSSRSPLSAMPRAKASATRSIRRRRCSEGGDHSSVFRKAMKSLDLVGLEADSGIDGWPVTIFFSQCLFQGLDRISVCAGHGTAAPPSAGSGSPSRSHGSGNSRSAQYGGRVGRPAMLPVPRTAARGGLQ